jgi:DNA-binding FadR family transcriptional regulator
VTREAVKMLTAKGLLSARPRQGTIVQPATSWNLFDTDVLRWLLERQFSVELLKQFNQLRVAIEPEAAALAARFATRAGYRQISAGLARMEAADRGHDDTLDADIAFHVAILRASGNPFYAQFRDMVATALAPRSASPTGSRAAPPMSPIMPRCATRSRRAIPMRPHRDARADRRRARSDRS